MSLNRVIFKKETVIQTGYSQICRQKRKLTARIFHPTDLYRLAQSQQGERPQLTCLDTDLPSVEHQQPRPPGRPALMMGAAPRGPLTAL